MKAPRICLAVDEVAVSGLSPRDARRLIDALKGELRKRVLQDFPESRIGGNKSFKEHLDCGTVRARSRIERSAAPLAQAIVKAVLK